MEEAEVVEEDEEDEDVEDGGVKRDQDLPVVSREVRNSAMNEPSWEVPVTRLNDFQLPKQLDFS